MKRLLLLLTTLGIGFEAVAQELPKVVLLGDSIRLGYAPHAARLLEGKATVVSPAPNGGDSENLLRNLEEWALRERPDVLVFNCGLHDLKVSRATGHHQVALEDYERNLQTIVGRLRRETSAGLVFANTTPILDDRHRRRGADFDRYEADVRKYNTAAERVMNAAGIPVLDLHGLVELGDPEKAPAEDGTHYTQAGYGHLAAAVADTVLRQLTVLRYKPLPTPKSGPEARAEYFKAQADRDALVPSHYRNIAVPPFEIPRDRADWDSRRGAVKQKVVLSLGDLPSRPSPLRSRIVARELRPEYVLERVAFDNGVDGEISALLLIPRNLSGPAPAILWLHSSTPDKTQIIIPGTNGGSESLGEAFVRAGYIVLSPDAYWHGDRAGSGPAGPVEVTRGEQESLFKWNLWLGRTLWGMFVRDDQIALDYLWSRPEVDRARIGATGMSMGSTRAWWLAAVDERISAVVAVACFTRYQNLIAHGELRQHGVYYFVDGLLRHFDTEGVLSLIAPRPLLALTGELDAGSPADGIEILNEKVGQVYAALGGHERFRSILYPETGHTYTPEMRARMLEWFDRWFKASGQ